MAATCPSDPSPACGVSRWLMCRHCTLSGRKLQERAAGTAPYADAGTQGGPCPPASTLHLAQNEGTSGKSIGSSAGMRIEQQTMRTAWRPRGACSGCPSGSHSQLVIRHRRVTRSGICARKARSTTLARSSRTRWHGGCRNGIAPLARSRYALKLAVTVKQRLDRLVAPVRAVHERGAALGMPQQEVDRPLLRRILGIDVINHFFHGGFSTSLTSTARYDQSSIRASNAQLTTG